MVRTRFWGLFTSRLNFNLRETKGTRTARSRFDCAGSWSVYGQPQVRTNVTDVRSWSSSGAASMRDSQ